MSVGCLQGLQGSSDNQAAGRVNIIAAVVAAAQPDRCPLPLAQAIERILGIRVELRLVEPRTIARSEGKAKRVIDRRNV